MKDMCRNVNSIHRAKDDSESHWYALKVFYNKVFTLRDLLNQRVDDTYIPLTTVIVERAGGVKRKEQRPLISSLMFIRTSPDVAYAILPLIEGKAMMYTSTGADGRRRPVMIPEREMNIFMLATSNGEAGVEYIGDDSPRYHSGDRVRVTDGPFKGSEGHIARIRGDHRLVVTIDGLCAVATSYIPRQFLEPVP